MANTPPDEHTPLPPPETDAAPEAEFQSVPPAARRPPRWPQVVRWTLLGVFIAFALGLAGVAGYVGVHATPGGSTFGWPLKVTGRTNILIMGLDRTVSDQNPNVEYPVSRTDTLIAASFDPATHRVYLLSIPRDTRTTIPGHGFDKINAAHAYAGEPLTTRTVENLLGVSFPYYIELHVRGLVHLIDAVGGVTVRIPKDLNYDDNWDGLHIHLKQGNRRLGGAQAMGYSRFRHDPLGDIGRIQRQQQVLDALLVELRQPRIVLRADRVLNVFRQDTTTNLDQTQLIALGAFGARLPHGSLVRETLPGRFGGYDGYWLPDPAKDRALVIKFFYGMDATAFSGTTIEVVNASGSRDVAADAIARLNALGLRVLRVTTAADASEAVLIVHRGDPAVAHVVAGITGVRRIVRTPAQGGPDLSVVLGRIPAAATPDPPAHP
ncbi:MAG TPA: LCP family protein [bacterium]|nr:LCP family protein [bacterium]